MSGFTNTTILPARFAGVAALTAAGLVGMPAMAGAPEPELPTPAPTGTPSPTRVPYNYESICQGLRDDLNLVLASKETNTKDKLIFIGDAGSTWDRRLWRSCDGNKKSPQCEEDLSRLRTVHDAARKGVEGSLNDMGWRTIALLFSSSLLALISGRALVQTWRLRKQRKQGLSDRDCIALCVFSLNIVLGPYLMLTGINPPEKQQRSFPPLSPDLCAPAKEAD